MKMRQDKNSGTRYVEVGMYTVESSHEFCMELFALNNESWTLYSCVYSPYFMWNCNWTFPIHYRTQRLITLSTKACHRSLFWSKQILFTPSLVSPSRCILILCTLLHLGLPNVLSFRFYDQNFVWILFCHVFTTVPICCISRFFVLTLSLILYCRTEYIYKKAG